MMINYDDIQGNLCANQDKNTLKQLISVKEKGFPCTITVDLIKAMTSTPKTNSPPMHMYI